ncbi:hypothetical protein L6R52_06015 [Myxococcota bacterium]|nr:hypothetical protein [Myxococcota bacterium]
MSAVELSEEQALAVWETLEAQGPMHAVALVRSWTGADLAEALAFVRSLQPDEPQRDPTPTAEIIAVGPFAKHLIPILDYSMEELWAKVPEGTPIVTTYDSAVGDEDVRRLAATFGVDPWDFNAHALDYARFDRGSVAESWGSEYVEYFAAKAKALHDAGFRFYFLGPDVLGGSDPIVG